MVRQIPQFTLVLTAIVCVSPHIGAPRRACAQDEQVAAPPEDDRRIEAEGTGVYLDDSFEAADALGRLSPLIRAGRWREAAELLQGVSDKYGDKLIQRGPGYYVGLRSHVNEIIAGWPAAGLEAYRALFERDVSAALARSARISEDSPADYLAIVDRFFCTHAALELAERAAQRAIEDGDFPLAEHVYRRLLDEHPDTRSEPGPIRARLAVVRALMGRGDDGGASLADDDGAAQAVRDDGDSGAGRPPSAQPAGLNARVRWKGQDRPLRDVLASIDQDFTALRAPTPDTEWPIFNGDVSRNRQARCDVDELGVQWRFDFEDDEQNEHGLNAPVETDADALVDVAQALTVQPVVSDDLVFVQRDRQLIALRRTTGDVVWRFGAAHLRSEGTAYAQERPTGWDAVTVADDRVYAAMSGQSVSYFGYESAQSPSELLCLDARTGRVIWRSFESALAARLTQIQFDSSPIVEHNRLSIVGRRRRSFGFEDCYLFRIDARNGRLLSQSHIGSASTGTFGLQPATKSIVASHGDTIYVCSNLGSIAAVSAYTGTTRWVRLYDRIGRGDVGSSRLAVDVATWHYNPVLWTQRGVIALPMDAGSVFVISPKTGDVIQTISRSELGDATTLLGYHDGLMCVAGRGAACYDLDAQRVRWSSLLADRTLLLGRGVWANDRIMLPTTAGLSLFGVADGARTDVAWDPDGEFGNLVALPDQLLVAGGRHLTAYVRKSAIWNELRSRLAASPDDPIPALEFAEVAMRGGESDDALDALQQAVSRAQAGTGWQDLSVRQRLFGDAMAFARTLAERGEINGISLDTLFDVASSFPNDTQDHLEYRLRFAAANRAIERPDRAVILYQQVLGDRSLRDLPIAPDQTPMLRASVFCVARIEELIDEHGAEVYAPFEEEAQQLLEAASASGDESMMARVVEAYPNSRAAPRALLARGTLLGQRGRPVEAVRLLIQAYHRNDNQLDRPALLKQIADTLEWAGRRADALRWLTKAALEYPSVVIVDRDERLTFAQCRDRLDDVRGDVEQQRARLSPPIELTFERTFPAPVSLLTPKFGDEPGMRWSRGFVYSDSAIHAVDPKDGSELWSEPLAVRERVDLLGVWEDLVLFSSSFEVFGVDPVAGRRLWSRGSYPPALGQPGVDWEDVDSIRTSTLHGKVVVTVRDGGRMTAIDVRNGTELWSDVYTPAPTGEVSLGDRLLAYSAMQNDRVVIGLVNASNGVWIDAILTDEHRVASRILQTLDEQVILVTSQTVSAYDVERRMLRWRVSTGDHLKEASILLDLDAIYLSPDGRDLRKISLEDGRILWEAVGLVGRGEDDLTLRRIDAQLLVTTSASVISLDAVTGMILWRGTPPKEPQFENWLLAREYLIGVNVPEDPDTPNQAVFYDLRNASGVIPPDGAPRLGPLADLRRVIALDGAILYQSGSTTVRGVTKK